MNLNPSNKELAAMSHDQRLELADALIDRDAESWKRYVREGKFVLDDYLSRRSKSMILRLSQR